VTRKAAVRRLEELGYDHLDGKSLVDAASEGNNEAVELFLAAGVPIDTPRYDGPSSAGDTAFFAAAQSGYLDTAALLLKAGTNVKVREQSNLAGNYGQTPLMVLSQYCDEAALVNAVIDAGADVNAMARTGDTALKAAEKGPCPEIASILRKAGATR
jgi:ankyrin repeat protein